ncbi:hypothetical protein [Actinoplanes sp. NPDC023714]|uniref:hypothetical protein n=1 Tax=Actinoplanes sp. NPDC023714 TaxID=3154322 RepID=UPI0033F2EF82
MARLILTHGIGKPREAAKFRDIWVDALADGATRAGHGDFATALRDGVHDVEFVSYGSLFTRDDQSQGADLTLPPDEQEIATEFFREIVAARREEAAPRERVILDDVAARLDPPDQPQGVGAPVNTLINAATTLLAVPPMRRAGQWLTAKAMVWDFQQVARYLGRGEPRDGAALDVRIRQMLLDTVDDRPAVVVAHSLGSVVTLEALHETSTAIPLLVTVGSPLGMRSAVWPRVRPRPPRTPECVGRWLNFWDRDDIIAVNPILERRVRPSSSGVLPVSNRVDSDGLWVHDAIKYLAHADVAGPVAEAMKAP